MTQTTATAASLRDRIEVLIAAADPEGTLLLAKALSTLTVASTTQELIDAITAVKEAASQDLNDQAILLGDQATQLFEDLTTAGATQESTINAAGTSQLSAINDAADLRVMQIQTAGPGPVTTAMRIVFADDPAFLNTLSAI